MRLGMECDDLVVRRGRCYGPTVRRSIASGTDCERKDGGLVASVTVVNLARPFGGLFATR